MGMGDEVLLVERVPVDAERPEVGVVVVATINRPDKLNALNQTVMSAIKDFCADVERDDKVRCIVFTGAAPAPAPEGKRAKPHAFVAGADISEFQGLGSEEVRPMFSDNGWEAIWRLSLPTIAMVDGFALGGGCEVAVSCDLRVASDRSRFGTPEINLGLIPGGGGTQRLARLIGHGRTMEMVYTGEMIDAQEAHRIGLVNHVTAPEELRDRTMALARSIGSKSAHTLRVAKSTIRAALETSLSDGVQVEADAFANLFDTEDKEIGVNAFLAREPAVWKHR